MEAEMSEVVIAFWQKPTFSAVRLELPTGICMDGIEGRDGMKRFLLHLHSPHHGCDPLHTDVGWLPGLIHSSTRSHPLPNASINPMRFVLPTTD